ncbi:Trypanosome variant surface glycoprotein (A-type)/Trypanosome variant surface glycoprotein C-terminal domain containing protein, putative [Trypanosoma equiperdum]|uniref:Trypanosome variant surface glycoprotein (A-type)/Trypanosome variant surface glycoprotein C-terminal domain containing protein, putative n=1 Tax=Trypanosoma equiperdum TaxID=5694 RepID=A0A1G4I4V3_TRYEQ|nr:Trypanosome variant surface glycoprotein (A-type)/Trypanosome variant surface glycoprotein C-terminal domain containing protein, putative [Trypanosoma equiperdum]
MSQKRAIAAGAIDATCELAETLRAVGPYANQQIQVHQSKAALVRQSMAILAVLAMNNNRNSSSPTVAMHQYLQKLLTDADGEAEQLTKKLPTVATKAALAAGRLDEFVSIFWQVTHLSSADYCIAQAVGTDAKATATQLPNCLAETTHKDDVTEGPSISKPDPTAVLEKFGTPAVTSNANSNNNKCKLTQTDATNGGYTHGNLGGTQNILWAAGLLTVGNTAYTANGFKDLSQPSNRPKVIAAAVNDIDAILTHLAELPTKLAALSHFGAKEKPALAKITAKAKQLGLSDDESTNLELDAATIDELSAEIVQYKKHNTKTAINEDHRFVLLAVRALEEVKNKNNEVTAEVKKLQNQLGRKDPKSAETTCNEAKDNQEECKKLESQGCVFNKDGKDGEKCTLRNEEKEKLDKESHVTGGKDGKKEECKGKQQKDCTGNCKWENDACKDSSILLNKQFALTVVSFSTFFLLLRYI